MAEGPVLLTGGSGFVGGAVMRQLVARGYSVRALARAPARLLPLEGVEAFQGDLTDSKRVEEAARGCSAVIHCAADYRLALGPGEEAEMIATNVGGTANVLRAAGLAQVRRMVHCSTVGTLAFSRSGRVCDERDRAPSAASLVGPYKRTKWAAERLVLTAAREGLEVVVVQPSTPVGPGDRRPTPTGQMIRDCLRGRIPAVVDSGLNLVSVEAVAEGHLLALERGAAGRSYILGDRNLSLRQLLGWVSQLGQRSPPRSRVPFPVALSAAALSELLGRARHRPPAISLTSVRMAQHPMYVRSRRAQEELGWSPGDLARALGEAVLELGAS